MLMQQLCCSVGTIVVVVDSMVVDIGWPNGVVVVALNEFVLDPPRPRPSPTARFTMR